MYSLDTNGDAPGKLDELIVNLFLQRSGGLHRFLDPHRSRDIDDECHYPKTGEVTPEHYRAFFDREAVANRVVQILPHECWQSQPTIYEDENADAVTPFEQAWDELGRSLRGESHYQDEQGNPIWEYLRRVDILSGIGHFGLLLLGLDDGTQLEEPVAGFSDGRLTGGTDAQYFVTNERQRRLLYVRAFDESLIEVARYETDHHNPRYGQPVMYRVTLANLTDQHSGVGMPLNSVNVHWSRVIHIADNLGSSEVFGVPRMQPVLNRLYDLRKLYGGSAEMYWRGSFPGLSFETHPQLGGDVQVNVAQLKEQSERYFNTLQRALFLSGMTAKPLSPQFVDPSALIDVIITAICIELGVPKRVFMGSERGQLASGQDDAAWNGRLKERQQNYLTPRLIVPFVDRLIRVGVLPVPANGFHVEWPDLDALQPLEQADLVEKRTDALAKYIAGDVSTLIAPMDFLTRELGYTEEEAQAVLSNTLAHLEDGNTDEVATAEDAGGDSQEAEVPEGDDAPALPD